jgi:hypothetical protein
MIPFGDEQPRRPEEKGPFVFRLYVVDEGPGSARAIANLSAICKNHLPDNHQIEIVDLLQDPRRVLSDHILATPTLIKLSRGLDPLRCRLPEHSRTTVHGFQAPKC